MSTIKYIEKVATFIQPFDIEQLEAGAERHLRLSNISFSINSASALELVIRTEQGKTLAKNYASVKVLIERTRDLFGRFLPDAKILVHPIPYHEAPVTEVDGVWIRKKMLQYSVKIKDIANDTGLNKTHLSALINESKPLSQIEKAFFYYYFKR